MSTPATDSIVEVHGLATRFGKTVVHEGLDLNVRRGEVLGIVGASGSGKSVLLRVLIMLLAPAAGTVLLFGRDVGGADTNERNVLRRRFGVMFQRGALFSSLSVTENIGFPLREHTSIDAATIASLARLKLSLVGLSPDAALKFPPELSGGMLKRVAIARALALDPELLFLDEPSAGLDPVGAAALDELILRLNDDLGITVVMISHDLDSLWRVTDRVAFIGDRRILALDSMRVLSSHSHSHAAIAEYFSGPRARAVRPQ